MISTIFVSLPNCFTRTRHTVNNSFSWAGNAHQFSLKSVGWICVAAGSCKGLSNADNPGPLDIPAGNGVSESCINTCSAKIANRRKPGVQRTPCEHHRAKGTCFRIHCKCFHIAVWVCLPFKMDVKVYQSGEDGVI